MVALEQDNFEIASMGEEVDPHFRPPSKIESDAVGRPHGVLLIQGIPEQLTGEQDKGPLVH